MSEFRVMGFVGYIGTHVAWVRRGENGPGIKVSAPWEPMLFSERNGYQKFTRVLAFRIAELAPLRPVHVVHESEVCP